MSILLAAASLASTSAFAQNDAKQTIVNGSVTLKFDVIRPNPQRNVVMTSNFQLVLSGKNQVDRTVRTDTGYVNSETKILGVTDNGVRWSVAGPNRLRVVKDMSQSIATGTLTVSGKTCRITYAIRLKPSFTEHKADVTSAFTTVPKTVATTCAIR